MRLFQKILLVIILLASAAIIGFSFYYLDPQRRNQNFLEEGQKSLREKRYTDAITAFRSALEIKEDQPEVIYQLAKAYNKNQDLDKALQLLQDAKEQYSKNSTIYCYLAKLLVEKKEYKEALTLCDKYLERVPEDIEVQNQRALVLMEMGYRREAQGEFQKIIFANKDHPRAYLNLSQLFWKRRRPLQAISLLENFLEIEPENFEVRWQLALFHLDSEKYQKAVEELRYLYEKYPDRELEIAPKLALGLLRAEEIDKAVKVAKKALQNTPVEMNEDPVLLYVRGISFLQNKKFFEAISDFSKAKQFYQKAELNYHLAKAWIGVDKELIAMAELSEAVRKEPRFLPPRLLLIQICIENQPPLWEKAEHHLKEIISYYPANLDLYRYKAQIHLGKKEYEEARKTYRRLKRLAPKSLEGDKGEIRIDIKEKNYTTAIDQIQSLLKEHPEDAELFFLLSQNYFQLRDLENALANIYQAISLAPSDQTLYDLLAQIRIFQKRPDLAALAYQDLLEEDSKKGKAWQKLIDTYLQAGAVDRAASAIAKAEQYPDFPSDFLKRKVQVALRERNYQKALTLVKQITEKEAEVVRLTADAYLHLEEYARAISFYQIVQMLELESKVEMNIAVAYYVDRNWQKAASMMEEYLGKYQPTQLAHLFRAVTLLVGDQREEIEKEVEKAKKLGNDYFWFSQLILAATFDLRNDSQFRQAFSLIEEIPDRSYRESLQKLLNLSREANTNFVPLLAAFALKEMGFLEIALSKCEEAVQLLPEDAFILYIKATTLVALQRQQQAQKILKKLAQAPDSQPYVHEQLAKIYAQEYRYPQAEQHYRMALSLAPKNNRMRFRLAQVLRQQGKFSQAIPIYKKVLKDSSTSNKEIKVNCCRDLLFIFTESYYQRGSLAVSLGERAFKMEPYDSQIVAALGRGYFLQGNITRAERMLQYARDLDPLYAKPFFYLAQIQEKQNRYSSALDTYAQVLFTKRGVSSQEAGKFFISLLFSHSIL